MLGENRSVKAFCRARVVCPRGYLGSAMIALCSRPSTMHQHVQKSLANMPPCLQNMSKTVMMAKTAKGAQKQVAKTIRQATSTVKGAASRTTKSAGKTARKTVRWEPLS